MALVVSERDSLLDLYNVHTHSFANYRPLLEVKLRSLATTCVYLRWLFSCICFHFRIFKVIARLFIYITLYLLFCNS